jgi:lipid-A-disaccharide synthase
MRIGIVSGESSGDLLGAGLLKSIKQLHPDATFEGIGGPLMLKQGMKSLFPMERLAVMGIIEVFGRVRELLRIRRELFDYFTNHPPDIFVGIDAPDFNLGLENKLRRSGIKTVHYVSPSVWAWRQYRIKKITRSVDLMLTLFPFEADYYKRHKLDVQFVGHPLADSIPMHTEQKDARKKLGLPLDKKIIALLPGSRSFEVRYLSELFLNTAHWCLQKESQLHFVVAAANSARKKQFETALEQCNFDLPITIVNRQSQLALGASDVALLASGTITLECLLVNRPMVVAYRTSFITYKLVKMMAKVENLCLPNILADDKIVPEFFQDDATVANLGPALLDYLRNKENTSALHKKFKDIHKVLKNDANKQAAAAIVGLVTSQMRDAI